MRKIRILNCKTCKKDFTPTSRSVKNLPQFCSYKCRGISFIGKGHPRWVELGKPTFIIQGRKKHYIIRVAGKTMYYHRYLMEKKLKRKLKTDEVVHHINGNHLDNRIENLQVMNHGEHSSLHGKGRKRPEFMNGKHIKCHICKTLIYKSLSRIKKTRQHYCSKKCRSMGQTLFLRKNWKKLFINRLPRSTKSHLGVS